MRRLKLALGDAPMPLADHIYQIDAVSSVAGLHYNIFLLRARGAAAHGARLPRSMHTGTPHGHRRDGAGQEFSPRAVIGQCRNRQGLRAS